MSRVQSSALPPPSRTPVNVRYRRGRAAVSLAVLLLLVVAAWLLNGTFTARAIVGLLATTLIWGWVGHLVMSVIELALVFASPYLRGIPLVLLLIVWALVLPFGVFDVWSSATAILGMLHRLGLIGLLANGIATALAELLAFAPEPLAIWLGIAIGRLLKE